MPGTGKEGSCLFGLPSITLFKTTNFLKAGSH